MWAVVNRKKSGGFQHLANGVIRTESSACDAVRYATTYTAVNDLIQAHTPDLLLIEKGYFNKNVSSCLSTASVIVWCCWQRDLCVSESLLPEPSLSVCAGICLKFGAKSVSAWAVRENGTTPVLVGGRCLGDDLRCALMPSLKLIPFKFRELIHKIR